MTRFNLIWTTLVVSMACCSAGATNYIFFGQQPLTAISDKGEFSAFELGGPADDGRRYVIDTRLAAAIVGTLWMYPGGGEPKETKARVAEGYIGCDRDLVVEAEDKDYRGLLSSKRLRMSDAEPPKELASTYAGLGRELLSAALRKNGLAPKQIAGLLMNSTVTPVAIFPKTKVSLVISASSESADQTATALLVATPDARGQYVVSKEDILTGGASDSESFAGEIELILHADFDGDGVEELLIRQSAYEAFGADLLQWTGSAWQSVASNGGGC